MAIGRKLQDSLTKTRRSFFGRIVGLFQQEAITEDTWDELEMLLVQADVGVSTTMELIERLRAQAKPGMTPTELRDALKRELVQMLEAVQRPYLPGERMLHVILVVGVNGSGKTTSIAKLARYHQERGDKVLLAAADTFRAAAIDQLAIWAERLGVGIVAPQPGADPGAVVYDAIRACQSRGANVLIVDTAGRLHTKYNLMQELVKVRSVAQKQVHRAPHETLLVLDATTGQNALLQARTFAEKVQVSGIVLAKLDSTAKGGIVFAIAHELGLPVQFAATGESVDDWAPFEPALFVDALFDEPA